MRYPSNVMARADNLLQLAEQDIRARWRRYQKLAASTNEEEK